MKQYIVYIMLMTCLLAANSQVIGQESIFTGLGGGLNKADKLYSSHSYEKASAIYEKLWKKDKDNVALLLKLANSYYYSNEMLLSVEAFDTYQNESEEMSLEAILNYANALQAVGKYEKALIYFKKYNLSNPDDFEVSKKIWQLQNIKFLYEDSLYYEVNPLVINSSYDEIAPEVYGNSLIYLSNHPKVEVIKRVEGTSEKPFFYWKKVTRTASRNNQYDYHYVSAKQFGKEINSKFHKGAISFSPKGDTLLFTKSREQTNESNSFPMQLYFAIQKDGKWIEKNAFEYNNKSYSITHPVFSDNGNTIYFSSDMPGGFGGKDLYKTTKEEGKWKAPVNLGNEINTSKDEGHPFINDGVLYFSSNGHPGLGGLDIFKTRLSSKQQEVMNFGYPVNTPFDDFNFILDSTEITGYLVSNRDADNDNIFEVRLKRMLFPITIVGNIKYKPDNTDASELIELNNATLELIEKTKKNVILTTTTDTYGKFSIDVPFDSQYVLRVVQKDLGMALVSFDIPKNNLEYLNHEIVIIK